MNRAEHAPDPSTQLMPAGVLVTVPPQEEMIVSVYVLRVKEAPTFLLPSMDTIQVLPIPEQAPVQPEKKEPFAGVTESATAVALL